jgi:hypothetical protein
VFGGYFDPDFQEDTRILFSQIDTGNLLVVISELTAGELLETPAEVRNLIGVIPPGKLEIVPLTEEITELAERYIKEGELTKTVRFRCTTDRSSHASMGGCVGQLELSPHGEFLSHTPIQFC